MATSAVAAEHLQLVRDSYARCQEAPEFFRAFYDRLLASDPAIPPFFVRTKFEKQDRLLQHGLSLLLIYAKRPNPSLLARLAERHGPSDLGIPAHFYPLFVESLLATVSQYDQQAGPETLAAWRASIAPGIAMIAGAPA